MQLKISSQALGFFWLSRGLRSLDYFAVHVKEEKRKLKNDHGCRKSQKEWKFTCEVPGRVSGCFHCVAVRGSRGADGGTLLWDEGWDSVQPSVLCRGQGRFSYSTCTIILDPLLPSYVVYIMNSFSNSVLLLFYPDNRYRTLPTWNQTHVSLHICSISLYFLSHGTGCFMSFLMKVNYFQYIIFYLPFMYYSYTHMPYECIQ